MKAWPPVLPGFPLFLNPGKVIPRKEKCQKGRSKMKVDLYCQNLNLRRVCGVLFQAAGKMADIQTELPTKAVNHLSKPEEGPAWRKGQGEAPAILQKHRSGLQDAHGGH